MPNTTSASTAQTDALGRQALLAKRIQDLALHIEGTRLEKLIAQLYAELDQTGIRFKPQAYLADEWGCPDDVPLIGIPFYLADPELAKLEGELTGVEAEDEAETMMYLRHEAGHAFNYAYRLYEQTEWQRIFGPYEQPYQEEYKPTPFSARYVRHVPGWYSQKHPDEDFAETFAVWLTPDSDWRTRYVGTPALSKLKYVERIVRKYGRREPLVKAETPHAPVEELTMTLGEWYASPDSSRRTCTLPIILNEDLRTLLPAAEGQPAADLIRTQRSQLRRDLHAWTGIERQLASALMHELIGRVESLGLKVEPERQTERLLGLAIFTTTLAMNYRYTDEFVSS